MAALLFGRHAAVDGTLRLTVTGEVDMGNAEQLATVVNESLREPDVEALIVDLDQVGFLDSSGVRVLLQGHSLAAARDITFAVANPRPIVRRVLDITGVLPMLSQLV